MERRRGRGEGRRDGEEGGVRGWEGEGGKERREEEKREVGLAKKESKGHSSILVNFYVAEATQLVHTAHKMKST